MGTRLVATTDGVRSTQVLDLVAGGTQRDHADEALDERRVGRSSTARDTRPGGSGHGRYKRHRGSRRFRRCADAGRPMPGAGAPTVGSITSRWQVRAQPRVVDARSPTIRRSTPSLSSQTSPPPRRQRPRRLVELDVLKAIAGASCLRRLPLLPADVEPIQPLRPKLHPQGLRTPLVHSPSSAAAGERGRGRPVPAGDPSGR